MRDARRTKAQNLDDTLSNWSSINCLSSLFRDVISTLGYSQKRWNVLEGDDMQPRVTFYFAIISRSLVQGQYDTGVLLC